MSVTNSSIKCFASIFPDQLLNVNKKIPVFLLSVFEREGEESLPYKEIVSFINLKLESTTCFTDS